MTNNFVVWPVKTPSVDWQFWGRGFVILWSHRNYIQNRNNLDIGITQHVLFTFCSSVLLSGLPVFFSNRVPCLVPPSLHASLPCCFRRSNHTADFSLLRETLISCPQLHLTLNEFPFAKQDLQKTKYLPV